MKTLVIQVKVGNTAGYAYQTPGLTSDFESTLIPTVKRWCDSHDYDYKMITEYPADYDLLWFNRNTKGANFDYSKGGKNKSAALIRYFHMFNQEYDRVISLDCDVFIKKDAPAFPELEGHAACEDTGKETFPAWLLKLDNPIDVFVNGGVQAVSRDAGLSLSNYVKEAVRNQRMPTGNYHSDQGFLNEWRSKNTEMAHVLSNKWNYMAGIKYPFTYEDAHLIHYAGQGRSAFLEHLKNGFIK